VTQNDRKKAITGQAQNLMGFTGIIQTILIALIITMVTNKDAQMQLSSLTNYSSLVNLVLIGFVSYMITAFFCLIAFLKPRWRIPGLPKSSTSDTYQDRVNMIVENTTKYELKMVIKQYGVVIDELVRSNKIRYWLIVVALIFLVVGLTSTLIGGYILLNGKVPNYPIEGFAVWLPLATGLVVALVYVAISVRRRTT
jgi:hypothetical protein